MKRDAHFPSGDHLLFTSRTDESEVGTTITALHHFPTFADMFSVLSPEKFGGKTNQLLLEEILAFYTAEEQKKWGVVGIEFILENQIS